MGRRNKGMIIDQSGEGRPVGADSDELKESAGKFGLTPEIEDYFDEQGNPIEGSDIKDQQHKPIQTDRSGGSSAPW